MICNRCYNHIPPESYDSCPWCFFNNESEVKNGKNASNYDD